MNFLGILGGVLFIAAGAVSRSFQTEGVSTKWKKFSWSLLAIGFVILAISLYVLIFVPSVS